ncbi:PEP-CTERM sorting domain-containing protein [Telmatocola sphagniphila]|uniref:PEP-CTERM sorting domain-containing protein n=1 Tax=Telmatocola sphagniphila TaxID=1123043 RepID=A0A8E6B9B9_9BACT|nr:PEP-CTERM sorting domain-containing protein [Telmatocola sphagniphila]QVL34257.1 PEP-CTERM sorting domain-containing protein [Telmatocola sphagniphila]
MALTATTGSLTLNAGTISGGTFTSSGGSSLNASTSSNNQLSGVAISGTLNLSGSNNYVRLTNGSTFSSGSSVTIGTSAGLGIGQTSVLDNVSITLGSNSYVAVEGNTNASLGSNVLISQSANTTGQVGNNYNFSGTGNLTNGGKIQAINTSSVININPTGTFTNTGTLLAGSTTGGGTININPTGNGVGSTSPTWSNSGQFMVDSNGVLNLGGRFTTAGLNLGGITRLNAGGTINITGTLDNTVGGPLALTATTGSLTLNAGTISGGTFTSSGGSSLNASTSSNNQLSGVAISGTLNLSGSNNYVRLTNGSTFSSGSSLTIGSSAGLGIGQSGVVDNVSITLGSNSYVAVEGNTNASLGGNVVIIQSASTTGNVGNYYNFNGTGNLTSAALIQASNSGSQININPTGSFTNNGTLVASNGGTINLVSGTTLTNLASGTLTGGSYVVQGSSTMNFNGRTISTLGAGTSVTLDGSNSVFAAINTLTASSGNFKITNSRNFTVSGGTFTNNGTLEVGANSTFTGAVNTSGGTVQGVGTIVGNVGFTGTNNLLQTSPSSTTGNLTITGNFTLNVSTTVNVKLNGNTSGSQYDRITITGSSNAINLANALLNISLGYDPSVTDKLYILVNQPNNSITGTFSGLPNDSFFSLTNPNTGHSFTAYITYYGNSSTNATYGGNDVLIAFSPVPEPASLLVLGSAIGGVLAWRRRSSKKS